MHTKMARKKDLYLDLYEKAKELLSSNRLEECHEVLTQLLDGVSSAGLSSEQVADAYNTRGHVKYLWVDFDGAILDYTQAIRCDSTLAVAYYNRGQVHYRMGES